MNTGFRTLIHARDSFRREYQAIMGKCRLKETADNTGAGVKHIEVYIRTYEDKCIPYIVQYSQGLDGTWSYTIK